MKKAAKPLSVKKTSKKITPTKKTPRLFEIHQLPVIVSLVAVILAAILVMTKMYLPKQDAETYWLEREPMGTPILVNPEDRLSRLRKRLGTSMPIPTINPYEKPIPIETVDPTGYGN